MSKDKSFTVETTIAHGQAPPPPAKELSRHTTAVHAAYAAQNGGQTERQPPDPNQQFNYNFSLKLFIGRVLITEQIIHIPHAKIYEAWKIYKSKSRYYGDLTSWLSTDTGKHLLVDTNVAIEETTQQFMFALEQAFNNGLYRCHVEQLPSDIPQGVTLETEQRL